MKRINVAYLWIIGLSILVLTFILCMSFGATTVDIKKAFGAIISADYNNMDLRILLYVRLPRCLGAIIAGISLAVSGVLIQAVLNNPMAAPNIIGVNSGAGLSVIMAVSLFPDNMAIIPGSAFFGALMACLLIYFIANLTGSGRITITLVGIAVTSVLNASISAVKTVFPNTVYNMSTFAVGGLGGVNFRVLLFVIPFVLIALVISVMLSRNIDILCLGEDVSLYLGMNVSLQRFILLVLASVLAGCAVSFAGLLGFVGLVVPHIVRLFVGNRHILLIPLSALFGAEFVLICDLLCRVLFRPYEIPVGILLSFIGGIFFIALILSGRRSLYD